MCTSGIDFGHLVICEIRNLKNRKTSSRLAEFGQERAPEFGIFRWKLYKI